MRRGLLVLLWVITCLLMIVRAWRLRGASVCWAASRAIFRAAPLAIAWAGSQRLYIGTLRSLEGLGLVRLLLLRVKWWPDIGLHWGRVVGSVAVSISRADRRQGASTGHWKAGRRNTRVDS